MKLKKWMLILCLLLIVLSICLIYINIHINLVKNQLEKTVPAINVKELEPGDIIFSKTYYSSFFPGYWTHTGVFVGFDENDTGWVIESNFLQTIKKFPLSHVFAKNHYVVGKVKGVSKEEKEAVVKWVESKIGSQFNYIYGLKGNNDAFYCSEVPWKAYLNVTGIDLDSNPGWTITYLNSVFPQEIYEHPAMEIYRIEE